MSISFPCPACRVLITVGDTLAGERTSCPHCGAFVPIPATGTPGDQIAAGAPPVTLPPPPPDEDLRIAPGAPAYTRSDLDLRAGDPFADIDLLIPASAWNLTRIGLGLMYWGIVGVFLAILGWIALVLAFFILAAGRRDIFGFNRMPESQFLDLAMFLILGAIVAGFVIVLIGQGLCCTAPPQSGARGQAIGSLICLLLCIAVAAVTMCTLLGLMREGFAFGPALLRNESAGRMLFLLSGLLAAVLYITSHVLFVLFLRAVGRHFRNDLLVFNTGSYLTMYFIFLGINLVANCAQAAVRDPNIGMIFGCLGLMVFILGVVVLVWYLRLLAAAKDTIVDALRRIE